MDCAYIRGLLPDYIEGKLQQQEHTVVREHISSCAECRQFFLMYKEMYDMIETEKQPVDDPFMNQRIKVRLDSKYRNWWPLYLKPVVITAMILLMVFSGIRLGIAYAYKQTVETDYANEIYLLGSRSNVSGDETLTEKQNQ